MDLKTDRDIDSLIDGWIDRKIDTLKNGKEEIASVINIYTVSQKDIDISSMDR